MRAIGLVFAVSVLAACQSAPQPKEVVRSAPSMPPTSIHGRALFPAFTPPSGGAALEVQLLGESGENAVPATVAVGRYLAVRNSPYGFDLRYDRGKIEAGASYSLRATLRDANGHLEFVTAARAPVTPGATQRTEFHLVRTTASH